MSAGTNQSDGGFSARVVGLLVGVGLLSFAAAALVGIYADPQTESTSGANAYSYSAIGHKAWAGILEELGIPVVLSRSESAAKAWQGDSLLVMAEPNTDPDALEFVERLTDTDRVLLVLPKWRGFSGFENRRWVKVLQPLDAAAVERVLQIVDEDAELVRPEDAQAWQGDAWDLLPSGIEAPQLIRSERITPLVYGGAGILLGEIEVDGTWIWVLSDPDVISNSGIDEAGNAVFAVAIVDALLPAGSAVVFDETIHGFTISPDLWKALLAFPLNLAALTMLVAAGVLVWSTVGRFGAPLPPRPRLEAGKEVLIANTASLFEYAGSLTDILRRYHEASLRDLARHLHVPRDIEGAALAHWLDQVGEARGATQTYSAVSAELQAAIGRPGAPVAHVLRAAARFYRWKQEMMHGHRADPDGLRPGPRAGAQDRRRTGRRA